jgi:hypothetical protein
MSHLRALVLPALVVAVSVAVSVPLSGCDRVFGLEGVQPPPPPGLDNGYTCECQCTYADGGVSDVSLSVCVPASLDPNLPNGSVPTAQELMDDCTNRVQVQVQRMSNKCFSPNPSCTCFTADPLPDTFYHDSCDQGCTQVPLASDCSNWDPRNGVKDANCGGASLCVDPGPVCLKEGTDPPTPTPSPLAAGIMSRVTRCAITDGLAQLTTGDDEKDVAMGGVVNFAPAPTGSCSSEGNCVSMDYRLDGLGTIHYDGFLGFGDTDISRIVTTGASVPFAIGDSGTVFVDPDSTQTSGRAYENDTHRALIGSNGNRLVVDFDGDTCGVQGDLLGGGIGDPSGDNEDVSVRVAVSGYVENSPPQASFGSDRTVECTSPAGADVALDASASSDREGNIVSYAWFLGSRTGDLLGTGPTITVSQSLGPTTYVLKAIDGYMQADEASATITVADTTAPTITCNAPATVVPRETPYTFIATASDVCDDGLALPTVLDYSCFAYNKSGKMVTRQCDVTVSGDSITLGDPGGIGNHLQWRVREADAQGNANVVTCETVVVQATGAS